MKTTVIKNTVLLLLPLFTLIARHDVLATDVSGTIVNQTWTSNNSPYRVVGDILVAGLTIKPGVTVLFASNYVFEIAGVLTANGGVTTPIVFMGTNSGWQGMFFNYSSPGSVLAYCVISNSVNSGIRILNSEPWISDCVIAGNSAPAWGGGINATIAAGGNLLLQDCTIANNSTLNSGTFCSGATGGGGGLYVDVGTNGLLQMDGCLVSGNTVNPSQSFGAYLGGGMYVRGSCSLRFCKISENICYATHYCGCGEFGAGGGILVDGGGHDVINNCIISDNQLIADTGQCPAPTYGGGMVLGSGSTSLAMTNTTISGNLAISATTKVGGGLLIDSRAQGANIVNCTIAYNNPEGINSDLAGIQVVNSILFFNNGGGTQIVGVTNVSYSGIQGGFPGTGNISANPIFLSTSDLIVVPGSPCINKGSTNAAYNDVLFPPSLGSSRNDMGAHGGPGAGARLRLEVKPQIKVSFLGGVPGYNYLIQASTNLLDWQTVQQAPIAHVGDVSYFFEPTTSTVPYRFYKLNVAP